MRKRQKENSRLIIAVFLVIVVATFITLGYLLKWGWTGFNQQVIGSSASQYQPEKTLWDWLQLLVIPVALAIGGFWLTQVQKERENTAAAIEKKREETVAAQRAQEETLQTYIDKLSELLRDNTADKDKVYTIAHVQTLRVFSRLD